jgi:hypothetical protein
VVRRGRARLGEAGRGEARLGAAGQGMVRQGKAWCGMAIADDDERRRALNRALNRTILQREPPDELTRAAPWYQRVWTATSYSTIRSVVKYWLH